MTRGLKSQAVLFKEVLGECNRIAALFALYLVATKCNVTFDVGFGPVINAVTVTWCDLTLNCPAKRFKPNPI